MPQAFLVRKYTIPGEEPRKEVFKPAPFYYGTLSSTVEDRVRRSKTGDDASDLCCFYLFGLFNAFPCDQTVVDRSESKQFNFITPEIE